MRGWRSVAVGALTLLVLQTVVATNEGPGRVAGFMGDLSRFAARLVDPTVPAIGAAPQTPKVATATPPTTTVQPAPVNLNLPPT